jgi:hypothetical protein
MGFYPEEWIGGDYITESKDLIGNNGGVIDITLSSKTVFGQ